MFKPPTKIPYRHEIHGDIRDDTYFWMRERDSEPVLEYLKHENLRTEVALKPVAELESALYREMRARIKEDDSSVPAFDSGYFYQTRYLTGQEYPVHIRKKDSLTNPDEVILDENELAKGLPYCQVGEATVSPNQRYLAYAVDSVGRRIYNICFKDLSSGELLPDKIEGVTANVVWAADNQTLFYVRQDPETLRSYQVYRYQLGGVSELVFEEPDTTFNVGLESSKHHDLIFMSIHKRDSSEWRVLDARDPCSNWRIFSPREHEHEYSLMAGGDRIFIHTNWKARNFRVMEAPVTSTDKKDWSEVQPGRADVFIEGIDVYQKFIVLSERENGLTQLRVKQRPDAGPSIMGADRILKFPDPVYEVGAIGLPDYASSYLRFRYESMVQPPVVYDEEVSTQQRTQRKMREVPGYHPALYETKRLWSRASDGTLIPISLLHKKGVEWTGNHPALLYGYGSYGLTTDPQFRSHAFTLVDRGFVFALAHVRGGSEMGREWYEQGRLQHKMNSFTDFIACAETLIAQKYTSSDHLYAMGGSAGGLLMGAVMNLRPDLFKGIVAAVPFVDVLTTMLDESIPLTTGEYNEWGDPRIKPQYLQMKAYSPYDNVEAKAYPHVLVTTGYHDSQVQYWEPAKWVARLRELKTDENLLLLYTELDAGHSGASGRFEALKTLAKEYAFILMLEGAKG